MHKNHLYTWAFTLIDIYSSSTLQVNVALFDSCLTILCCNVTSLPSPGSIMFMAQCLLLRFCVFFLLFDTLASFLLQNPSDILYPSSSHSSCQFSSNRWFIFTRVHTQFTFSLSQLPPQCCVSSHQYLSPSSTSSVSFSACWSSTSSADCSVGFLSLL